MAFTSLPVVVFALMEQDVNKDGSLSMPNMYSLGQQGALLNPKIFGLWILDSVAASVVCFLFCW